jgi:hypothetical protein
MLSIRRARSMECFAAAVAALPETQVAAILVEQLAQPRGHQLCRLTIRWSGVG